jgi:hypothetical protein
MVGWDNVSIVLVEDVLFDSRDQLLARERYWIDTIGTLNKVKPLRTAAERYVNDKARILAYTKQYNQDNKDRIVEKKQQYYQNNKDQIKQRYQDDKERILAQQKQYYEQNKDRISEKHNCHCGGRFTTQTQSQHFKSNKHIQFMASLALSQEQRIPPV